MIFVSLFFHIFKNEAEIHECIPNWQNILCCNFQIWSFMLKLYELLIFCWAFNLFPYVP